MLSNVQQCDCGVKTLNLIKEQVDDFWEAHDECYYHFEYVKPRGTHSDQCICGDTIESFPDSWYEMWTEVHNEHKETNE
jgi:hypothetical protein